MLVITLANELSQVSRQIPKLPLKLGEQLVPLPRVLPRLERQFAMPYAKPMFSQRLVKLLLVDKFFENLRQELFLVSVVLAEQAVVTRHEWRLLPASE
jgi:hypothetical protein